MSIEYNYLCEIVRRITIVKQIPRCYNLIANCRRVLCAWRLRARSMQALAMLLLALTVSLGEPLLCIVHCQLWLPMMFGHYLVGQHQHHHMAGMDMPGMAMGVGSSAAPNAALSLGCQLRTAPGAGVPFHVPPSPVHDLLPAIVILLPLALLVRRYLVSPLGALPSQFFSPRLPPPRFFAI